LGVIFLKSVFVVNKRNFYRGYQEINLF
jgi:hypothetical protein